MTLNLDKFDTEVLHIHYLMLQDFRHQDQSTTLAWSILSEEEDILEETK